MLQETGVIMLKTASESNCMKQYIRLYIVCEARLRLHNLLLLDVYFSKISNICARDLEYRLHSNELGLDEDY
jgi:hypothetical protein